MNHDYSLKSSGLKTSLSTQLSYFALAILVMSTLLTQTVHASSESGEKSHSDEVSTSQQLSRKQRRDKTQSTYASKQAIEVDIVENPRKFSFDETPAFEDGAPAYGGEFITQGFIYKQGTLEMGDGVDVDGNPEFPERLIGTWFCRGWHVGDGARTVTGPIVITHQLFNFGSEYGEQTIATDGIELADIDKQIKRAITGGTGKFKYASGEQIQYLKGINQFATEEGNLIGVKLRVKLKIH